MTDVKRVYNSWGDINCGINSIFSDIYSSDWKPDITVGISPCSVVPSLMLSNRLNSDFEIIKRDPNRGDMELNAWIPELAFGINEPLDSGISGARWDPSLRKNILVFISENNNNILEFLKKEWESICFPNEKHVWNTIWNKNVKFATLYEIHEENNCFPTTKCDYVWKKVYETGHRNVFPWSYEYWTKKY